MTPVKEQKLHWPMILVSLSFSLSLSSLLSSETNFVIFTHTKYKTDWHLLLSIFNKMLHEIHYVYFTTYQEVKICSLKNTELCYSSSDIWRYCEWPKEHFLLQVNYEFLSENWVICVSQFPSNFNYLSLIVTRGDLGFQFSSNNLQYVFN